MTNVSIWVSICHFNVTKMNEIRLSVRVSEPEMENLERLAKKTKRTKTDLVREWLRTLENIKD